jgi:RHH-type transcriptional regulator, proline utilization regulon repressor / proline dehydrogenase / delta 1-pyrroline-5-carboxylate dehydrogenase
MSRWEVSWTDPGCVEAVVTRARAAQLEWDRRGAAERADVIDRFADLMEQHGAELMALCAAKPAKRSKTASPRSARRLISVAITRCRLGSHLAEPTTLPGSDRRAQPDQPARSRRDGLHQPVELSAGDLRRPGRRRPGDRQQRDCQAGRADAADCPPGRRVDAPAGVPDDVLFCLPGGGELGAALTRDPRIAGVVFTGSTETARAINRTLAERDWRAGHPDRRNRRSECHDRRFLGTARAGGA